MDNLSEWHVFTKDGEEYKGEYILTDKEYTILFHYIREHVTIEKRKWYAPWVIDTINDVQDHRAYDYMIPTAEILRVERWDV